MKIGTRSILYGAHAFWLHPIFVFIAWWQLFGFPWNFRLWIAFFVHDLGYWGTPNMDGKEGEAHVRWGAERMMKWGIKWCRLCFYHSRFWAAKHNAQVSSLCIADKWAMIIEPTWLYLLMARATGEIREYRNAPKHQEDSGIKLEGTTWADDKKWSNRLRIHMTKWICEKLITEDYDAFPREDHYTKASCAHMQKYMREC